NAFTVGLALPDHPEVVRPQATQRAAYGAYFARLQNAVEHTLCRSEDTRPGRYRAAFQVWLEGSGRVRALHLLGSTGDESRDAAIVPQLVNSTVAAPPPDLPQPLTVVLRVKAPDAGCPSGRSP